MNCLRALNLLSAYIDRELSPDDQRQMSRHLAVCPSCRAEWQSLMEVKEALSAMPSLDLPVGFWAELDSKLAAAEREPFFGDSGAGERKAANGWLGLRRLVPVGMAAATLLVLVGTQIFFHAGHSNTTIQLTGLKADAPAAESDVIPVDSLLREHYRYAASDTLADGLLGEGQYALPGRLGQYLNRDFPENAGIAAGFVSGGVKW